MLQSSIAREFKRALAPVRRELAELERRLYSDIMPADPDIAAPFLHLGRMKGKLLRPALVFLTARLFGRIGERHFKVAHAVELVHVASLIHDDVVDHSSMRRGMESMNARFGDETALLVGDYLFSKALEILGGFRDSEAFLMVARVISGASEGEMRQLRRVFDTGVNAADYLDYIAAKTARLFALATELSAMASGADERGRKAAERFGFNFGMAFQIADDCADLFGDAEAEGKPVRNDIAEGRFTLPVIRLFSVEGPAFAARWLELLSSSPAEALDELRAVLLDGNVIEYCAGVAERYVAEADEALAALSPSEAAGGFADLGRLLVRKIRDLA
ncbi:MAG: hypothetical protein DRP90_01535 [Planctomycetota bacterium]|nr:MAG: hypothetical protein DRP90_01535 [Planctomycetota bacterium]